jgi:small GTP-binding protein
MSQQPSGDQNTYKKLVVVGDGASGKTCLLMTFFERDFPKDYVPTIFDNHVYHMDFQGKRVDLDLWDTAGQEDYDKLRTLCYPGADVILLCFSVDNPSSLQNIASKWYPEVKEYCPDKPVILVGNKLDLRNAEQTPGRPTRRPCEDKEIQRIVKLIHAYAYVENSALLNNGVTEVFRKAVESCVAPKIRKKKCQIL